MRPFHLYAVELEDISVEERYFLATPDYCLLYTQNDPPQNHKEVEHIKALPRLAIEWLDEQIQRIQTDYLLEHDADVAIQAENFMKRFEAELEKEKAALES